MKRLALLLMAGLVLSAPCSFAEETGDPYKDVEKKRVELVQQEEAVRKERERLNSLRRELDAQIEEYNKLLDKIEEALKEVEEARAGNLKHLVKTYEAMPAEDAALRLSSLPEATAVRILTGMKSKNAGAVMALMAPKKVTALTRKMEQTVKNIPTR